MSIEFRNMKAHALNIVAYRDCGKEEELDWTLVIGGQNVQIDERRLQSICQNRTVTYQRGDKAALLKCLWDAQSQEIKLLSFEEPIEEEWNFSQRETWLNAVNIWRSWQALADNPSEISDSHLSVLEKAERCCQWWKQHADLCASYESISLNQVGLTRLPKEICQYYLELERLELKGNHMTLLPDCISNLHHLKELIFEQTPIVALPTSLIGRDIRELIFHQNSQIFPNLPFDEDWFPNLQSLICGTYQRLANRPQN